MLRRDWPIPSRTDAILLAMLGSQSPLSVGPIPGVDPPLDPPPWMEWRFGAMNRLSETMGESFVEAWVYDDSGQGYYNIDKIIARLSGRKGLYPYKLGAPLYADAEGNVVQQRVVGMSNELVDPDTGQHLRWVQWALRRVFL